MLTLGRAALLLAFALAIFGIGASVLAARRQREDLAVAARRTVYALFAVLTLTMVVVELAFIRSDFSFRLVASHSSTTTPLFYRVTAMWSSQEGSLLLWVWLLTGWSSLALATAGRRAPALAPWAGAVLLTLAAFFLGLVNFLANPLQLLDPAAAEGNGLQPLLRHPAMVIHPPMLYSGYTLATVPFAFAIAALVTRRVDAGWVRQTRRFALLSWLALTFGILLGARWSWSELGWGGYWAWDPVENAALLPWLTGTAALHSLMVQEKRGTLKTWNVSLALITGILAILGTFLVRSGILESIHAFGASTLGRPFLAFIALLIVSSLALLLSRRQLLRSAAKLDSFASRETVFVLNNVVLVGMALVILWGTFFPLISEALTGTRSSVGPPWFSRYTVPLAIVLVLLSGIGPLLPWRRPSRGAMRRVFAVPGMVALAALTGVLVARLDSPRAGALFVVAAFALTAVAQEYWRGARARRASTGRALPIALAGLVSRNRRRYGGYLVHAGVAVMLVGVAASSAFQHVRDIRMKPGDHASVGGYDFDYVRPTANVGSEKLSLGAVVEVRKDGRLVDTLRPSRGYYPMPDARAEGTLGRWFAGEATSEVGLRMGIGRDVWTSVEPDLQPFRKMIDGIDKRFPLADARMEPLFLNALAERYRLQPPPAAFRLIISPLVAWVWIGGLIAVLGGLIAIWPRPPRTRQRVRARLRARRRLPQPATTASGV
jgi:cytochrome c-type biogenesis protein CcmF